MPVVLSQLAWRANPKYLDVEGVIYHYPRQYFSRIAAHDRFIYYRPAERGHPRADERHYFGHGVLGEPFGDPVRSDHRFVGAITYEPFDAPVPLKDPTGVYYETESAQQPQAQSAVRPIPERAYYRILAAAGAMVPEFSASPTTETAEILRMPQTTKMWPTDILRTAPTIPEGTGYLPRGESKVDVFESAALQERAREDHQRVLQLVATQVSARGGQWWYNNNIDLYARVGLERYLVEAKSLNQLRSIVDRMRYGMGQLFDYRIRYRAEIGNVLPVLAFGRPPDTGTAWVGSILNENGVAFVSQTSQRLLPLNELARDAALFR